MFKSIFYTKRFSCYDTIMIAVAGRLMIDQDWVGYAVIVGVWVVSLFVIDGIYKKK
ncbi:hypothetical protein D3C80_1122880 [compost metagenome]